VPSVEALSRRLVRGDLTPETPLFDGSTGEWTLALESPVVRFILDEMGQEGAQLPEGWEEGRASAGSGGARQPPSPPSAPVLPPFTPEGGTGELHLDFTLAELPPELEAVPPRPWEDSHHSAQDAGALAEPVDEAPLAATPLAPSPAPTRSSATHSLDHAGGGGLVAPPSRRRVARVEEPSDDGSLRHLVMLILFGMFAMGGVAVLMGEWLREEPGVPAVASSDGSGLPESPAGALGGITAPLSLPVIPPGMEAQMASFMERYEIEVDREVARRREGAGIPPTPPPEWLTGAYLAEAAAYPSVSGFWSEYQAFLEGLRAADLAIFEAVLNEAFGPGGGAAPALAGYLRERHQLTRPLRDLHLDQLLLIAERAEELHTFLVENSASLRHTPARGPALPLDPVLEVGTEDPEVRRGLDASLDALFEAIDQVRVGDAPGPGGVGEELFGGMGIL